MNKPQVGLVLLLEHATGAREGEGGGGGKGKGGMGKGKGKGTGTGHLLRVLNTHLIFNKNRGDIKLLQIATLLGKAAAGMPPRARDSPVVVCGDFNSTPGSRIVEFVLTGRLAYCSLDRRLMSGQKQPRNLTPARGDERNQHRVTCLAPPSAHPSSGGGSKRPKHDGHPSAAGSDGAQLPPWYYETVITNGRRASDPGAPFACRACQGQRGPGQGQDVCTMVHPFTFGSAMPHDGVDQGCAPPTTWHHDFRGMVDYIFYTTESLALVDRWRM